MPDYSGFQSTFIAVTLCDIPPQRIALVFLTKAIFYWLNSSKNEHKKSTQIECSDSGRDCFYL
ncbi:Uncharacterised protein [Yersinia frederiksenii]|nr:Uncharacterised protein [Yersinia frederiksenii]